MFRYSISLFTPICIKILGKWKYPHELDASIDCRVLFLMNAGIFGNRGNLNAVFSAGMYRKNSGL